MLWYNRICVGRSTNLDDIIFIHLEKTGEDWCKSFFDDLSELIQKWGNEAARPKYVFQKPTRELVIQYIEAKIKWLFWNEWKKNHNIAYPLITTLYVDEQNSLRKKISIEIPQRSLIVVDFF